MYFRFVTLVAFHAFLSLKVDATILEVGVGGMYDSTNIVPTPVVTGDGTADAPMEIVDGDETDTKPPAVPPAPIVVAAPQIAPTIIFQPPSLTAPIYPGGFPIDVFFEASKLPLDVAIFNSARASGGDEKIRKYLQAVLVIGGTALTPGMAHALESR